MSGVARTRFMKEVEDRKAEISKSASGKVSKEKLLHAPESGIAFICSGTTCAYTEEEEIINEDKTVKKGEILFYIMINRTFREVRSDRDGTIRKIMIKHGEKVKKGDPVIEFE